MRTSLELEISMPSVLGPTTGFLIEIPSTTTPTQDIRRMVQPEAFSMRTLLDMEMAAVDELEHGRDARPGIEVEGSHVAPLLVGSGVAATGRNPEGWALAVDQTRPAKSDVVGILCEDQVTRACVRVLRRPGLRRVLLYVLAAQENGASLQVERHVALENHRAAQVDAGAEIDYATALAVCPIDGRIDGPGIERGAVYLRAEILRAQDESIAIDPGPGAQRHTRLSHPGCAEKLQDCATIHKRLHIHLDDLIGDLVECRVLGGAGPEDTKIAHVAKRKVGLRRRR